MSELFDLVYADPAWSYDNKVSNGTADNHYGTMSLADMKALPVNDVTAKDAVLIMWYTGNFNEEARELAKAWGFKVKTMKFITWVKLNAQAKKHIEKAMRDRFVAGGGFNFEFFMELLNEQIRMGLGNYTRSNSEDCLIAVKGKGLKRLDASIKQVVITVLGEHSAKPEEVRHRIERMYGDVRRLEMFSRTAAPGWRMWGNESPVGEDVFSASADNDNEPADRVSA